MPPAPAANPADPADPASNAGSGWLPLLRVAVAGESMLPTLRPGDWCLVRRGGRIRPGAVVVIERPDRPGLLVVKRAVQSTAAGWWVLGDNPVRSDDSRVFGPVPAAAVVGRVLGRYAPWRRLGRIR